MAKKATKKTTKKPRMLIRELYAERQKREEAKGRKFSLRDFAVAMGDNNPENGRANMALLLKPDYNPTFSMMVRLAKAFECKIKDLFEE